MSVDYKIIYQFTIVLNVILAYFGCDGNVLNVLYRTTPLTKIERKTYLLMYLDIIEKWSPWISIWSVSYVLHYLQPVER